MAKYYYKAKEGPQKIVEGFVQASSKEQATNQILVRGLAPLEIYQKSPEAKKGGSKGLGVFSLYQRKVRFSELVEFTRQLSDLVEAHVPVLRSLEIILRQIKSPYFSKVLREVFESVSNGASLSDALAKYPHIFSDYYINLVRTGETGGQLGLVLKRLAQTMESQSEIQSQVRSSLAYPALIVAVGILTVFVMISFVVPRLSVIFDDFGQSLPAITRLFIHLSLFMRQAWWVCVLAGIAAFFYFRSLFMTDQGRYWIDQRILKTPLIGEYIRAVEFSRMGRTLGTLLDAGVVLTTAMESMVLTIQNSSIRKEVREISQSVVQGASLYQACRKSQIFSEGVLSMIGVGEETGQLGLAWNKVADVFERRVRDMTKTSLALLGPLVLIVIVVFVGFIVIAMLLPIMRMNFAL